MCWRNTDIYILYETDVYLTKILNLQETLLRTHLFSNHFDHWTSQGFEFDTSMKQEALKPSQEALMKLFAVSIQLIDQKCYERIEYFFMQCTGI